MPPNTVLSSSAPIPPRQGGIKRDPEFPFSAGPAVASDHLYALQALAGRRPWRPDMAASAKPKERDLVAEAARAALDAANGDVREATRALEESVRSNRRLRDDLTDPLLSNACYAAVTAQCRVERRKVWTPPAERLVANRTNGSHRVVQLAAGTLLMFPLPGGRKLGEATREEITEAAQFYEAQATDMGVKARWLRLVAQSVPGDKTAGDVLTDRRLRELQEAARGLAE